MRRSHTHAPGRAPRSHARGPRHAPFTHARAPCHRWHRPGPHRAPLGAWPLRVDRPLSGEALRVELGVPVLPEVPGLREGSRRTAPSAASRSGSPKMGRSAARGAGAASPCGARNVAEQRSGGALQRPPASPERHPSVARASPKQRASSFPSVVRAATHRRSAIDIGTWPDRGPSGEAAPQRRHSGAAAAPQRRRSAARAAPRRTPAVTRRRPSIARATYRSRGGTTPTPQRHPSGTPAVLHLRYPCGAAAAAERGPCGARAAPQRRGSCAGL